MHVRETSRILSTYTGDTSGVCSALFELGGMTVMHDPSGCNSTYSTHDEPRWYDSDSLVFISGLTEKDAIFGNDEKLICDTVEAAGQLKPRFIAIAGTPIPYMTGCDFNYIASEIEKRSGIPAFGFETNGMHSYIRGANMAFSAFTERMCQDCPKNKELSVNILGVTPLDFSVNGSEKSFRKAFEDAGIKVNSLWSLGTTFEELEKSAAASYNVVASSCGIDCAKVLKKKFGIPYILGAPYGAYMTESIIRQIKNTKQNDYRLYCDAVSDVFIIGEPITSLSLATAISNEVKIGAKVIVPMDSPIKNGDFGCICIESEDEIALSVKDARIVIADPMYKPICSPKTRFVCLPHEAFSGRIYRDSIPDLISDFYDFSQKILN